MQEPSDAPLVRSRWFTITRPLRRLIALALCAVALVLWIWGNLAIRYSNLPGENLPHLTGWVFTLGTLGMFLFMKSLWRAAVYFFIAGVLLVTWWSLIGASNDRNWLAELSVLAKAEIGPDQVTVRNIRNFNWLDANHYEPAYYDKTFDLEQIAGVDLVLSYWDEMRAIAHTIVSFHFEDGSRLAVSIEIRREEGEDYDTMRGIFKQFELYYVVADENDVIKLRTNRRGEDVFLYPTMATKEQARALFLDYMQRIDSLAKKPEFYHTIFNNCTTNIVDHVNRIMPNPIPYGSKILLNGYSDELAYNLGWLDNSVSYSELRKIHNITERALAAEDAPDFSARIRATSPTSP